MTQLKALHKYYLLLLIQQVHILDNLLHKYDVIQYNNKYQYKKDNYYVFYQNMYDKYNDIYDIVENNHQHNNLDYNLNNNYHHLLNMALLNHKLNICLQMSLVYSIVENQKYHIY